MFYLVYDVPAAIFGPLFVGGFVIATCFAIYIARRAPSVVFNDRSTSSEIFASAIGAYLSIYGILLGLVAVATYQNHTTMSDIADREGSVVGALARDFNSFPPGIREKLRLQLADYADFAVTKGWDAMRRGETPRGGDAHIDALFDTIGAFEPATASQQIRLAEAFRQLNQLVEVRRQRLANSTLGLPQVLWWVVFFGAFLAIVLILFLDLELLSHMIIGGTLAAILSAIIFLIVELDNPFRGEIGVTPDSLTLVLDTLLEKERKLIVRDR